MITITVGEKPLYIPKETVLVLEQHNNTFDIDNITSDIVWTFEVPAQPNAEALRNTHFEYVSNYKKYKCSVGFCGMIIANGQLYVQSVSNEKTVSCGIILDGLGKDFGKRKLKDNEYGDNVVISQPTDNIETHRANWLQFLYNSLSPNSVYKFFLFCCKDFYKNNEAYGYHQNVQSTLQDEHDDIHWSKYINRLITYRIPSQANREIILNQADSIEQGVKLFNTVGVNTDKLNGYAFAPAIRLDWLVKKIFENAGYNIVGDFLNNSYIKKLYIQSMNAMDGDFSQFGLDEYLYIINATGNNIQPTNHSLPVGIDEKKYDGFNCTGNNPIFNFGIRADVDGLVTNQSTSSQTAYQPWQKKDEVFMLLVRTPEAVAAGKYPKFRCVINRESQSKDYIYGTKRTGIATLARKNYFVFRQNNVATYYDLEATRWEQTTIIDPDNSIYGIQLTPSTGNSSASYPDPEQNLDILGNYTAARLRQQSGTNNLIVELVKMRISTLQDGAWDGNYNSVTRDLWIPITYPTDGIVRKARVEYYGCYEGLDYIETIDRKDLANTNTMLNIFDIMLRWKQHVPNVSNGDFIKKICKFFGLSFYVNPFHKIVQLSFANDLFEADFVDISNYIVGCEKLTYEPKQYEVTTDTVLGKKSVAEDFLMEDVKRRAELESARSKKRMSVFVENENAYNIATQDDETKKFSWETSAGNDKKLTTGNSGDEVEEVSTEILVPNMKVVDTTGAEKYLCDIETSGNSKLMDDDYNGEFDMILQQYKGRRFINLKPGGSGYPCYIEDANPTCMDKDGNVSDDYLALATTGKNSVGEKWLKKFYQFKANQEKFRFQAKLPVHVFQQVYQTQMPQETKEKKEVRWIMVRNRKYMPLTISYEFNTAETVLATIECARQHIEL